MNNYRLFFNMLANELAKEKNFRGIIHDKKNMKIMVFSYIHEIDTFYVNTEYEDSDITIMNNDLTKKEILQAYQEGNLYMFDFLSDVDKYRLEVGVDAFFKSHFNA